MPVDIQGETDKHEEGKVNLDVQPEKDIDSEENIDSSLHELEKTQDMLKTILEMQKQVGKDTNNSDKINLEDTIRLEQSDEIIENANVGAPR